MAQLIQCNTCQRSFNDRSTWNNHVKAMHQKSVRATYLNGTIKRIERGMNGMFTCICDSEFSLGNSLRRHAKMCHREDVALTDSNGGEEGSEIDVEISDLPFDCVGISLLL